jgi:hypothetical protein
MSACVYSVFVLPCVQVAALRWAYPASKESYRLCTGLRNLKSGQGPTNWRWTQLTLNYVQRISFVISGIKPLRSAARKLLLNAPYIIPTTSIYLFPVASTSEHRASVKRFVSLQFLNLRQLVGLLGRGISPMQGF